MSDRNLKQDFERIDPSEVLSRVSTLPISEWSYKNDAPGVRHLGPMAQDFQAAFRVGDSDRYIHPIDAQGVALAAIQALAAQVEDLRRVQRQLEQRNAKLERKIAAQCR